MSNSPTDFLDYLVRLQVISPAQRSELARLHAEKGGSLRELILRSEYASGTRLYQAIAHYHGLPFIDLCMLTVHPAVVELVPESVARENIVFPLVQAGATLFVAVSDPLDLNLLQKLRFILNKDVQRILAPREQIIEAINRHYGQTETESVDSMLGEFTDTQIDFTELGDSVFELTLDADDARMAPDSDSEKESFVTDFDVPALEEESSSEAVALEDQDTDLKSSDFDLALSEDDMPSADESEIEAEVECEIEAEEEEVPAPRPAKPRKTERQATVRHYHRMNPEKTFPLLVIISKKKILEVVQRGVRQKTSQRFQVAEGSVVEVEPVLPGCTCYPPREQLRIGSGEATAKFWVVPHVLGEVMQARVVVRQDGDVLAEVPLEIRVVKQTLTLLMAALTCLLPLAATMLQHFGIDLRSRLEDGLYSRLAGLLLGSISPDLLGLLLLGTTVGLYLWLRPRKRDVFWDITAVGPEEHAELARRAFAAGEDGKGRELLRDALTEHPQSQAAWLLAADRLYQRRDFQNALTLYRKALAMGRAPAAAYMRASLAAGQLDRNAQALAILKEAVGRLPRAEISGAMWYNMGCFAARLGLQEKAVAYLGRAVDAGYTKLDKFRTDPDLAPLRRRGDFNTLVACIDS
jgi:hypothetical protein